jgi:hypothetical protein
METLERLIADDGNTQAFRMRTQSIEMLNNERRMRLPRRDESPPPHKVQP